MTRYTVSLLCVLGFIPSQALAFTEQLASFFTEQTMLVLVGTLGIGAAALLMNSIQWWKGRGLKRRYLVAESQLEKQQESLDGFISGVIHVNDIGNIVYCNRVAAYFLGSKADDLLYQPLASLLSSNIQGELETALGKSRETTIETFLSARKKHVRIRVAPTSVQQVDVAAVIALEDVGVYQRKLHDCAAMQQHLKQLVSAGDQGFLTVDFTSQQIFLDGKSSSWLGVQADTGLSLEQFSTFVESDVMTSWNGLLSKLESGETGELECHFLREDISIPVKLRGELASHTQEERKGGIAHLMVEDLRGKKALQRKLDESRCHVSALMSNSTNPMYMSDDDNRLVNANSAFCRLFGVSLTRIKNQPLEELVCFNQGLKTLHQFGGSSNNISKKMIYQRPDGSELTLSVSLQVYRLGGKKAGLVGMIQDVTESENLKSQLTQSQREHQQVMELSPFGLALVNENDNFTYANQSMCKMLGHSVQALKNKSLFELFADPEASGRAAKKLHQEGALTHCDVVLKGAESQRSHCRLSVVPFHNASGDTYLIWIQDANDIDFYQRQFQQLMSSSGMPVAVLTEEGFDYVNSAACAFFGVKSSSELLGSTPSDERFNASIDACAELANHLDVVRSTATTKTINWQHKVDEHYLPSELTLAPVRYGDKVIVLCLWVDLRKLEEANAARLEAVNLRQMAEKVVQEKQALLDNSQDQLAQKARSLETTQGELNAAQSELSEKVATISELQKAHQDISEYMSALQDDYAQSKRLLAASEQANEALASQLDDASAKVGRLQQQRNQIAEALQYSERQYKKTQTELVESEQHRQRLKLAQSEQHKRAQEYESQIGQLKHSIAGKDKQLADVGGKINALQSQLISAGETSETLRSQLVNQRKASEEAEIQRRKLAAACESAQSELESRKRHIHHLQDEMGKLEEMSRQQKGDMEDHTRKLADELVAKQRELERTRHELQASQQLAESQKQESELRQSKLEKIQHELQSVEAKATEQQVLIKRANAQWQEQQAQLQQALNNKMEQLRQTEMALDEANLQTAEEQAETQAKVASLKQELQDMEARYAQRNEEMSQKESERQQQQFELAAELESKQKQLQATELKLYDHAQQVDAERKARQQQEQRLSELKQELTDVELRAKKQQDMLVGSDEQWRQHHAEIEAQKQALQQALNDAQTQNQSLHNKLSGKLSDLQQAENQVSKTQQEEQRLQGELEQVKAHVDGLEKRLAQQAEREEQLNAQVCEQEKALSASQQNVVALKEAQERLTNQLQEAQAQYKQSQTALTNQDASQHELTAQLASLEAELVENRGQLLEREASLKNAQDQLSKSAEKLAEQEAALVAAQKAELQKAREQAKAMAIAEQKAKAAQAEVAQVVRDEVPPIQAEKPPYADSDMPDNPSIWFDLLPYLQHSQQVTSLVSSLTSLNEKLDSVIDDADKATETGDNRGLAKATKQLVHLIRSIESPPLEDMANRLEADNESGQFDNIAIFWPIAKQNLMKTQRVIYSHLHG